MADPAESGSGIGMFWNWKIGTRQAMRASKQRRKEVGANKSKQLLVTYWQTGLIGKSGVAELELIVVAIGVMPVAGDQRVGARIMAARRPVAASGNCRVNAMIMRLWRPATRYANVMIDNAVCVMKSGALIV